MPRHLFQHCFSALLLPDGTSLSLSYSCKTYRRTIVCYSPPPDRLPIFFLNEELRHDFDQILVRLQMYPFYSNLLHTEGVNYIINMLVVSICPLNAHQPSPRTPRPYLQFPTNKTQFLTNYPSFYGLTDEHFLIPQDVNSGCSSI